MPPPPFSCLSWFPIRPFIPRSQPRSQLINPGNRRFQLGVELHNVHLLSSVFSFDIAADRQVVIVACDLLDWHRLSEVIHILLAVEDLVIVTYSELQLMAVIRQLPFAVRFGPRLAATRGLTV